MKIEYTGEIHLEQWAINVWIGRELHNLSSYIFDAMGGIEDFSGTIKVEILPAFPAQKSLVITDAPNKEMNTDA